MENRVSECVSYASYANDEMVLLYFLRSIYEQMTPFLHFCPTVLIDVIYLYLGFSIVKLSDENMNNLLGVNEDDAGLIERRRFEDEMYDILRDSWKVGFWGTPFPQHDIFREHVSFIWSEAIESSINKSGRCFPQFNSICEIQSKEDTNSEGQMKSVWMFNSLTDYIHEVDDFHYLFPSFATLVRERMIKDKMIKDKIITFQQELQGA